MIIDLDIQQELINQKLLKLKCLSGEITFAEFMQEINKSCKKTLRLWVAKQEQDL